MDTETNAEMIHMMEPFIKKFNRVHFNNLLGIQGKDSNNLPMIPEHMDENKKRVSCAAKRHLVLSQAIATSAPSQETSSSRNSSWHYAVKSGQVWK